MNHDLYRDRKDQSASTQKTFALLSELPLMAQDRNAELGPHANPAILNTAFPLELVQMKSDGFSILAKLVRNAGDVW